jgi:predicted aminopeptidase
MRRLNITPSRSLRRLLTGLVLACGIPLLSGCETLQFYHQAVWGQLQLLQARTPVEEVVARGEVDAVVRAQLILAQQILAFGEAVLGLDIEGRYSSYVQLDRKYVVWNVFAADPYDLAGEHWCYPVVGCAPYRGYFDESAALSAAHKYTARGMETYVGGVPAYSTLGWFDDPILSTFIRWPEAELANLLLHEMAHSKVWVNGDVAFNESFAEFVGNRGSQAWLEGKGGGQAWQAGQERREIRRNFRGFAVAAKAYLTEIYAAPDVRRSESKVRALEDIQACYRAHRSVLGSGRYDALMADNFNNAFLVSVGTYSDWLPGFATLFEQVDRRWDHFFVEVEKLANLSVAERSELLGGWADGQVAHEVDCHRFFIAGWAG